MSHKVVTTTQVLRWFGNHPDGTIAGCARAYEVSWGTIKNRISWMLPEMRRQLPQRYRKAERHEI